MSQKVGRHGVCSAKYLNQIKWDEGFVAGALVLDACLLWPGWIPFCSYFVCIMETITVVTHDFSGDLVL